MTPLFNFKGFIYTRIYTVAKKQSEVPEMNIKIELSCAMIAQGHEKPIKQKARTNERNHGYKNRRNKDGLIKKQQLPMLLAQRVY